MFVPVGVQGVLLLAISSGAGFASQRAIGTILAVFFVPIFFVVVRKMSSAANVKKSLMRPLLHQTTGVANHE